MLVLFENSPAIAQTVYGLSWFIIVFDNYLLIFTSSTAQGGGGSFKNRKPIREVGCCESGMAKRIH